MCISKTIADLGFTEEKFHAGTHMCLIYNDDQERRNIIGKYLESGLLSGEKVAYFADAATNDDIVDFLKRMNVCVSEAELENISLSEAEKTYCPKGIFSPDEMLNTLRAYYDQSKREEYPRCRVSGEMSWALRGIPGSGRLMEYEALVNRVLETHPVTAICQYNANAFDGQMILRCLEVHPYMIIRGQVVHNPFYMKPEDFIKSQVNREQSNAIALQ